MAPVDVACADAARPAIAAHRPIAMIVARTILTTASFPPSCRRDRHFGVCLKYHKSDGA
jgi:hypothetical protein